MAKKRNARSGDSTGQPPGQLIPNVSLSRTARVGEKTEDEKLLERRKHARLVPRIPAQAEFTHSDPWRVLRMMGEFVHGFDALAEVGAAVSTNVSVWSRSDHLATAPSSSKCRSACQVLDRQPCECNSLL